MARKGAKEKCFIFLLDHFHLLKYFNALLHGFTTKAPGHKKKASKTFLI